MELQGIPGRSTIAFGHRDNIQETSLLLASQKIPHWAEPLPNGSWRIQVEEGWEQTCLDLIRLHQRENRDWNQDSRQPVLGWTVAPLWVLAIPFAWTELAWHQPGWFENAGIADAHKILTGQWWRCWTAQTLHADPAHLLSNMASGYFLLNLLSGRVRLGWAAALLSVAAALGNGTTAWMLEDHRSLGFSTFTFASLGAIATVEARLLPTTRALSWFRRLEPLGAAILLAVFVGIGEPTDQVDVLGHAFGFLWGVLLFAFAHLGIGYRKSRSSLADLPWIVLFAGWFGLCWWLALR